MFVLKGFIEHSLFMSGQIGTISIIGQLSTEAMTYARNKDIYLSSIEPQVNIVTFTVAKDNTKVKLTTDQVDHIATISKYIYDHTIRSQRQLFITELLIGMTADLAAIGDSFQAGPIVTDGDYYIPEWISWHSKLPSVDETNQFKIWLTDTSFREQYDDYEIVVVPPLDNLDDFFLPYSMVKTKIDALTPVEYMSRLQAAKNNNPETVIRADNYTYYDPYNVSHTINTSWSFLIYGIAGNNIDAINNALSTYILEHSTKTRDQWIQIIPEIFKHTEFTVIPQWLNYAIPNRTLEAGIYSGIVEWKTASDKIKALVTQYPPEHIDANLMILPNPYKSLALLTVGSPDNRNGLFKINEIFTDYINVQSTSADFTRMSLSTQHWATLLERMLIVAETATLFTAVPVGMSKIVRNDILYITSRFEQINYLVATKASIEN